MRSNSVVYGYYVQWFFAFVAGIIILNWLCGIYRYKCNLFAFIGRNAMTIYVSHWVVYMIMKILIKVVEPNLALIYTYSIGLIIFLPLIVLCINKYVGLKKYGFSIEKE